ncbi:hypothetical protein [Ruegeria sp. HKCCD7559]|uniref:hypothetical protein n=1 Tax=Ruegeria sp. HKCCD7559 TaxID=2683005 RepID=UPI0014925E26|nr:hypothetical protein [Ruegeria sp. HKCCD7559]NOC47000.1 hypothetical protein [Ruegeria sp. HKCCD7559]
MEWPRETVWRQGRFLSQDDVREAVSGDCLENATGAIVASQDCDIAASPEVEPVVEFVLCQSIVKCDGNKLNAKNPRCIHLPLETPEGEFVEIDTRQRIFVPKETLIGFQPCDKLQVSDFHVRVFQKWLALRYKRSAFPDAFNNRLGKGRLNITKAVAPTASSIEAVLFDLGDDFKTEITDPDEVYSLSITLVFNEEIQEDAEQHAEEARTKIEDTLTNRFLDQDTGAWEGIELCEVSIISVNAITVAEAESLLRFDLDELSFKEELPVSTFEHPPATMD